MDWQIVVTKNSVIANSLASFLNQAVLKIEVKHFADTECFIDFDQTQKIKNKNICIVQQFDFFKKNCGLDEQLFELLFLADFLKKVGAKKIVVVLPYLAYSRQDKSFDKKYVGFVSLLGKNFKHAGIDDVVSFDLHEPNIKSFFSVELHEIGLVDFWADFLVDYKKQFIGENFQCCLVSPDAGRVVRVQKISQSIKADFGHIKKERIGVDKTISLDLIGDVGGKCVAIVDDIVDTGTTAINACDLLLKKGAKVVIGCFSHGIFSEDTVKKIEKSRLEKVFVTDTIELNNDVLASKKVSVLPVGSLLCNFFEKHKF